MHKGQALIMVLLVLGITATIGLSIMSRSITEVSVSTTTDESARALEAAEAGVEKSLGGVIVSSSGSDTIPDSNASFRVSNTAVAGTANTNYSVPYRLTPGDVASVYLQGQDSNGAPITYSGSGLRICWGDGSGTRPAMEAVLYYLSGGVVTVGRNGYDGNSRSKFKTTDGNTGSCSGGTYQSSHYIPFSDLGMTAGSTPLVLRLRLVYNTTPQTLLVMPDAGTTLPVQGKDVISTGESGSATQRLHVIQSNPDTPMMFDMALFSGGSLVQ